MSGFDTISGEYFSLSAGRRHDAAVRGAGRRPLPVPALGLRAGRTADHDRCGRRAETVKAGDLFYWPPGHNVRVDADAEIVMFSPAARAQPRDRAHDREGRGLASAKARIERRSVSAVTMEAMHPTKQRLLDAGLAMLLEHGYNDLGIQALLEATGTPKGSFYHHFKDKEDFALQVVDQYMHGVHAGLDGCLGDTSRAAARASASVLRDDAGALPERGVHGVPARRARPGAVGRQRGVPAQDRGVLLRDRRAD